MLTTRVLPVLRARARAPAPYTRTRADVGDASTNACQRLRKQNDWYISPVPALSPYLLFRALNWFPESAGREGVLHGNVMNRVLHPFLWRWNSSIAMDGRSAAVIENLLFNLTIAKLRSTPAIGSLREGDNIVPLALYFPRFEYTIAGGCTIKRANVNTARWLSEVYVLQFYVTVYIFKRKKIIYI